MKNLKTTKEEINTIVTHKVDKYCCEKMKEALTILQDVEYVYGTKIIHWLDNELMITVYMESDHACSHEYEGETEYRVRFCPFCGERIE